MCIVESLSRPTVLDEDEVANLRDLPMPAFQQCTHFDKHCYPLSSTLEVRAEAAETLESIAEHRTIVLALQLDPAARNLGNRNSRRSLIRGKPNDAAEQVMERMLRQQLYGKLSEHRRSNRTHLQNQCTRSSSSFEGDHCSP